VCHRIVFGAPGWIDLKLFTFGFFQALSAIIHRTVWCAIGLSGAPSGATTIHTTVDCTVPWQSYSSRKKSEQAPEAHRTVNSACPVHQDVRAPTVKTVRTLTVGWHGWRTRQCPVTHWTVRCAHRQQPNPNGWFGGWGYKYPQPPPFKASKFSAIAFNTRALYFTPRHKQEIKSSPKSKITPNT
jgi:hypothetical protein